MPIVSVVLIFLNEERFIEEAIQSVVDQSFTDWELILVDDGSSDRSVQIAKEFAARDHRIRYFEHPGHVNHGMAASRNFGTAQSSAPYLTYLDGDDVWVPTKLAEQVDLLDSMPDVAMVNGAIRRWHSWDPWATKQDTVVLTGAAADVRLDPPEVALRTRPLASADPAGVDLMVRRTVFDEVGGFEQRFRAMFEDQTFLAKVFMRYPVYISSSVWLWYRQHPESSCARTSRRSYVRLRGEFLEWLDDEVRRTDDARVTAVVRTARQRLKWQRALAPGLEVIDRVRRRVPEGSLSRLSARIPGGESPALRRPYLAARKAWRRWWL